jgi:hypothetical protein
VTGTGRARRGCCAGGSLLRRDCFSLGGGALVAGVLVDDLREQVAAGGLVVVGAGVSVGASGGAREASWVGLLRDGVRRVVEVDQGGLPAGWAEVVGRQIDSGDREWLVLAAEDITRRLGGGSGVSSGAGWPTLWVRCRWWTRR